MPCSFYFRGVSSTSRRVRTVTTFATPPTLPQAPCLPLIRRSSSTATRRSYSTKPVPMEVRTSSGCVEMPIIQPKSVASILSSKSISTLKSSSILPLLSLLSSRGAFSGLPFHSMACFLSARNIYSTGEYSAQVNQSITIANR